MNTKEAKKYFKETIEDINFDFVFDIEEIYTAKDMVRFATNFHEHQLKNKKDEVKN